MTHSAAPSRPFDVVTPAHPGSVVVEVPHAGLELDEPTRRRLPREALERDVLRIDSDLFADELFLGAATNGATCVVARVSRYVIDLNTQPRIPDAHEDKLPPQLRDVRRTSADGFRWYQERPFSDEVLASLKEVFEPYHLAIERTLDEAVTRHGAALLLSGHTFPSKRGSPDAVIGTLHGATADEELRALVREFLDAAGLRCALEEPFPGGYAMSRHARLAQRRFGVQLELGRHLLTDSSEAASLIPGAIERLRTMVRSLVSTLDDAVRSRGASSARQRWTRP